MMKPTTLDRFTTYLSISTVNVNSLFKTENIEHVTFNKKEKRNDRKVTLKREILNPQILKGNNISILTDTRLNAADIRDIEYTAIKHT